MQSTIWAIVPPLLAIVISLFTKEVNLSLFIGILVGAVLFTGGNVFSSVTTIFEIMASKVQGNLGVLIFIILLGMIVHLMNLSGSTKKYALWASKKFKTKRQSLLATMALGLLIFIDDYFNCLTVGTVMSPITDKHRVSRERLAYIIDSTAAPVCIIAPISSWAAAVSSSLPESSSIDGFTLFLKTIFCNYYSLFTLLMVFLSIAVNVNFGKMNKYEKCANYDHFEEKELRVEADKKGGIIDLILPVLALIVFSIISMLYTGGLFTGESSNIGEAFANCDAIIALAMGGVYTVLFLALLYLPRKVITAKQYVDGLVLGFKNMVPATLILVFAWTLSGICSGDYLNAGGYVASVVNTLHISLNMVPPMFFVISLLLAFSTGTSWGTFAILLPITISVFNDNLSDLLILTTAAVLGGSVCGDHISPISDTTILSSTGAKCDHINHVESQLQYGLVVAIVTVISYVFAGVFENRYLGLIIGLSLILLIITLLKVYQTKTKRKINV